MMLQMLAIGSTLLLIGMLAMWIFKLRGAEDPAKERAEDVKKKAEHLHQTIVVDSQEEQFFKGFGLAGRKERRNG